MAKAGVWQGLVGVAKGAYAGVDSPAEGAVRGRTGRAGKAIEWDRCVSCCACGSRVAAIPSQTALRSHNSAIVLWRASTVCRMPRRCVSGCPQLSWICRTDRHLLRLGLRISQHLQQHRLAITRSLVNITAGSSTHTHHSRGPALKLTTVPSTVPAHATHTHCGALHMHAIHERQ